MVWAAICKRGKLPLVFIEDGAKVNQKYYLDKILKAHLLPEAQKLFGTDYFCFQQDGATSHTAKTVQQWCEANLPDFISKDEWPPSSQDLNPLDFCIWSYMQARLNIRKTTTKKNLNNNYKRYGTKFHWMSSVPLAIVLKNVCVYCEKPKVIDSNSIYKM